MRQLNGVYTQLFNKLHVRTGHLFQGRYKAILIQKDSHLLEVCRYVVLNPVRAGIVERPDGWLWSSFRATAGKNRPHPCLATDWVLGQFSGKRGKAEKEYQKHVSWGIGRPTIWTEVKGQTLLGEDGFVDQFVGHLRKHKDIPEIPRSQRYADRPSLEKLFGEKTLGSRIKRNKAVIDAVEKYGYRQREVADHLGLYFTSISRIVRAGVRVQKSKVTSK
jgi:hypothetical protein